MKIIIIKDQMEVLQGLQNVNDRKLEARELTAEARVQVRTSEETGLDT